MGNVRDLDCFCLSTQQFSDDLHDVIDLALYHEDDGVVSESLGSNTYIHTLMNTQMNESINRYTLRVDEYI